LKVTERIILVAGSAGMLAQAAKKSGLRPLVIDLFIDIDTQQVAEAVCRVPSLAIEYLAPAVDYFVEFYAATTVIYGSGFEYYPESLAYLESRLEIVGNNSAVFSKLLDKQSFFNELERLGILFPDVSFSAPDQEENWLRKPMRGFGGLGIQYYRKNHLDHSACYWQKYQSGCSHSVLFLANGNTFQLIAFNTQWTVKLNEKEEFGFSGIVNHAELQTEQKDQLVDCLGQLVRLYQLKGLNSLDFIHHDEHSYVLEINPRPSASMALFKGDLLGAHIMACQGSLANYLVVQAGCTGYQIVYANQELVIPEGFEWPDGCGDLPLPGAIIGAGQPICSIIAHQKQAQAVLKQLSNTQKMITNKLERFQDHAIYR
jgi:methenyltetrahydromethanopterin cyclohydrolase